MKFNQYIWSLYCAQEFVQQRILSLENLTLDTWLERYEGMIDRIENTPDDESVDLSPSDYPVPFDENNPVHMLTVEDITRVAVSQEPITDAGQATDLYEHLFDGGVAVRRNVDDDAAVVTGILSEEEWLENIRTISFALFLAYPEQFLPYDFRTKFHIFQKICEEFEIPLAPGVPIRAKNRDRAMFYLAINSSLQEFRHQHGLTPAEMCVFLEFAYENVMFDIHESLPAPSKVWFLIGGAAGDGRDFDVLDNADSESQQYWQGNRDTSPGDICMMWCVKPRSYLHSIWRATSNGFIDPFFWGYSTIWISQPIQVPHLIFAEIAADPVLAQKPIVRAHFQGSSGKAFSVGEYDAILALLARKSFDISVLPRIPERIVNIPDDIENERDVELKLVEPFLKELGYSEKDWVRQLPVRMGRGNPYYPDYAFRADLKKKGEESAKMVLETKFRLATRESIEEAYIQAKSYALRLQAQILVLAAIDGIWIFVSGKNGFTLKAELETDWTALGDPDGFHKIRKLIGPAALS